MNNKLTTHFDRIRQMLDRYDYNERRAERDTMAQLGMTYLYIMEQAALRMDKELQYVQYNIEFLSNDEIIDILISTMTEGVTYLLDQSSSQQGYLRLIFGDAIFRDHDGDAAAEE